ncbi:MAG: glycosyltransferase family 4 protein, partial [Anaerolineae bacterium]
VRDLWPESAVALGELQNPFAIRVATVLEKACYRRARRVVAVTRGIHDRLLERDIPARKVSWIPNGANTELFRPMPTVGAERRKELGLGGKFVAIYAGIHGIAQALETVLYAADRLKGNTDIHFLFIGDGPRKRDLVRLAEELRLPNVTMLDSQPRETIPGYLSAANIALVPLRDEELFKGAVPSKIFDAWACARPVLLGIDGEAREILERAQAGRYVEPESVEALVRAVSELSTRPDLCREYGANGRRFVVERYSRQAQARQLVRLLESL